VVDLAAMNWSRRCVPAEIAQANPHLVMNRIGDRNGQADSQESMRQTEGIEIAIAQKQRARSCSPNQGHKHQ
jgi:hypothetical protein